MRFSKKNLTKYLKIFLLLFFVGVKILLMLITTLITSLTNKDNNMLIEEVPKD